jgi:hypothetical protein
MAAKTKYTETQIGQLADAFGKSAQTIRRWILQNNPILTSDVAKAVLLKVKK